MARTITLIFAVLLAAPLCRGQQITLPKAEGPVAVNGPWRLTAGDPQGQADEAAKPSTWHPIGEHVPSTAPAQPAVLWFRTTLQADDPPASPALLIAPSAAGCQIFVNGSEAGNCSELSAPNDNAKRGILVHLQALRAGAPLDLAIRLYHPTYVEPGGLLLAPGSNFRFESDGVTLGLGKGDILFGSAASLEDHRTAHDAAQFYDGLFQSLLCVAELLGGALLLVAFSFDRRRREYAWFAAFLWLDGTCSLLCVFAAVFPLMPPLANNAASTIGLIARYAPLIGFLAAFTGVRTARWARAYQWILIVLPLVLIAQEKGVELGYWLPTTAGFFHGLYSAVQLPFVIGSLVFLVIHWRRGNKEAGLVFPSFLLANGIEVLGLTVPYFFRRSHVGRFGFDYDDLSMFFFLLSIGPVMLFRHRRISLDHARARAELDAAREIQQRLVPAMLPTVPGFALSAEYLPAAEVGGDFYQVFGRQDGSTLIVVGDVSGKGLKAAMKGTLLLGALGALAADEAGPGELLMRLNRETVRGHEEGFITCLAACIWPDGTATIANAGHLSPYRNGNEIKLETGLPLGLVADAVYEETALKLEPGDRLTLMSDGVVEARNSVGELFGFDRTCAISRDSAQAIAEAAKAFGQEDDITVLTLSFTAAD